MKRILNLFILFMAISCLGGCIVQSLHPFYTAEAVIDSPVKNGEWTMINEKGKPEMPKPWVFEKEKITAYDEHGASGIIKTVYFKVEDTVFIDAIADEPGKGVCTWWAMHLAPVHTICQVEIQDDGLSLIPIDYGWLKEALKEKTLILPYIESKEKDFILFTASSTEWMAFLKKHRTDNTLFSKEYAMRFIMQGQPSKENKGNSNSQIPNVPTSEPLEGSNQSTPLN